MQQLLWALLLTGGLCFAQETLTPQEFSQLDSTIQQAVDTDLIPGAVLVIGHDGRVV